VVAAELPPFGALDVNPTMQGYLKVLAGTSMDAHAFKFLPGNACMPTALLRVIFFLREGFDLAIARRFVESRNLFL
jgi:hypothetical protein